VGAAGAWYRRRVGLRGTALGVTGIGWITYGTGIITDPRYGVQRGVQVLVQICPLSWWGVLWIACGTAAFGAAVCRPGPDRIGFAAGALAPMLWAGAYVIAWLTGGYPQAWTSTPAWCVPLVLLGVVAALSSRYAALLLRYAAALDRIRALERGADGGE
jgi:hypothetical protein